MNRVFAGLVCTLLLCPTTALSEMEIGIGNPDGGYDTYSSRHGFTFGFKNSDGSMDTYNPRSNTWGFGFKNSDGSQDTFYLGIDRHGETPQWSPHQKNIEEIDRKKGFLSSWDDIQKSPEYWNYPIEDRAIIKAEWFMENIVPAHEFQCRRVEDREAIARGFARYGEDVSESKAFWDVIGSAGVRRGSDRRRRRRSNSGLEHFDQPGPLPSEEKISAQDKTARGVESQGYQAVTAHA